MTDLRLLDTIDPFLVPETIDPSTSSGSTVEPVLARGTDVDCYVVEGCLAEGAQATVYLCCRDERYYVLKFYRSGILPNGRAAALSSMAEENNIAPLYDRGTFRSHSWEVYPYYKGGTLAQLVEDGRCSVSLVDKVLLPCLVKAIAFLGKQGLVHADVKPANVFFTAALDKAVLGDMGVAVSWMPEGRKVPFRGSPTYAPRGAQIGEDIILTRGYDWGSLGLLLCYAYSGEQPFEGVHPNKREDVFAHFKMPMGVPHSARSLVRSLICTSGGPDDGEKRCIAYLKNKESIGSKRDRTAMRAAQRQKAPSIEFGVVDGRLLIARDAAELLDLCEEHEEMAHYLLSGNKLPLFIRAHEGGAQICSRYIDRWVTASVPARVFMLCCALRVLSGRKGLAHIVYDGHKWSISTFFDAAARGDATACELLRSSLFLECLLTAGMKEDALSQVRQVLDTTPNPTEAARVLRALFDPTSERSINADCREIEDPETLVGIIPSLAIEEISRIVENPATRPWLYRRGLGAVYKEVDAIHE